LIHKIKTATYEVRSHRNCTTLSAEGVPTASTVVGNIYPSLGSKPLLKRTIWHLQDVLKLMSKLQAQADIKRHIDRQYKAMQEAKK